MELKDLRLVVCGHIHEGRGLYANDKLGFPVVNVAVLTERYTPVTNPVVYIDWPIEREESDGYGFGV
jgi:Icc-related predicted phosphoesterase